MKSIIKVVSFCVPMVMSGIASADTYVQPHFRSNGTYVQGHTRSDSNGSRADNWSTRGNVNPYTAQPGYKDPYSAGYGSTLGGRSRSLYGDRK